MRSANGKPAGSRESVSLELGVCPVCKTRKFHVLADSEAIRRQVEALWEYQARRLRPGAPIEQFFDRAAFSQAPPFHLVRCAACGTVARNPRESEEAIVDLYARETPPRAAFEDLFMRQKQFYAPRIRSLTKLLGRVGSVLEVGSYVGGFLVAASDAGWSAHGVDVNEHVNAFARACGCSVQAGSIEDLSEKKRFDAIALWNCVDQLPDPQRALAHAHALVAEDGIVALRVPNGSFYTRVLSLKPEMLRNSLLAQNNLLGFPYRHGFTPKSVSMLLRHSGFETICLRGDTLMLASREWMRGWARIEEKLAKKLTRALMPGHMSPWIEVYAKAV